MSYQYNDGGRAEAGFKGDTGDCVTRAVAIATGKPYKEVYDLANQLAGSKESARLGLSKKTTKALLEHYGFIWEPTMKIGSGCQTHLKQSELPSGTIVVKLSKHICAVIDGVIHDTYDPSRDGTRCVYGYWRKP